MDRNHDSVYIRLASQYIEVLHELRELSREIKRKRTFMIERIERERQRLAEMEQTRVRLSEFREDLPDDIYNEVCNEHDKTIDSMKQLISEMERLLQTMNRMVADVENRIDSENFAQELFQYLFGHF